MWLSEHRGQAVIAEAARHGIATESPEQTVKQALEAVVLGQADEVAYAVTEAAGIEWITPHVWALKEARMNATLAREIIKQALADDVADEEAPDDDDAAVAEAIRLIEMAQEAWDQNVRGPEVEKLLKLAATDENGDEPAAKAKPAAKPKSGGARPSRKAEPEPEPEPEEDERLSTEPWDDYGEDDAKAIIEGVEVWAENEEWDNVVHVLLYEQAHRNRVRVVKCCLDLLPEDRVPSEGEPPEPDPEPAAEPEDETPAAREEPFEGYDGLSVKDVKASMDEYLDDESDEAASDEDKLDTIKSVFNYESLRDRPRTSLMDWLDEKRKDYEALINRAQEDASAEEAGAGEDDDAAASDDDAAGEGSDSEGKGDGKGARASAGARPGRSRRSASESAADEDGEEAGLIEAVHAMVDRERLHVPPALEEDPVELPFDLTTTSDTELQQLYSAFSAYSYRSGYLLSLEEAKEQKCKEAADEIIQAYLAEHAEAEGTVTAVKAQAEELDDAKKWRKRQRKHAILGASLRRDRDNYDKVCERLSRLETMRHDEWERSGNKLASRKK